MFDVAVVGLGALGSAAAYQAALKGAKVIGFEQFEFGHVKGASHDTSRIFRTSNPLPEQVALARSALRDWRELEQRCGHELLTVTGGIVLFPSDGPQSSRVFTESLEAENMPYKLLNAKEVERRWPRFRLSTDVHAVYTEDSGVIHASKAVAAMQYMARANGASLKEHTAVERILPNSNGKGVVIETSKGRFAASKVIIAADAWSNKLLAPLGVQVPLTIMQEQVTYFRPETVDGFELDNFPVWMWAGKQSFYGFPSYGEPTIKIARDTSENYTTPETRTFTPSKKLLKELEEFTQTIIPSRGETSRTITCQYTITPERQIILSPLDKHPDIILGLGAALGFKYAPAIGRVLAELAMDGKSTENIANFGIPKVAISKL